MANGSQNRTECRSYFCLRVYRENTALLVSEKEGLQLTRALACMIVLYIIYYIENIYIDFGCFRKYTECEKTDKKY